MNELDLYKVRVPVQTNSYSPVSHKDIIETVREELDKRNMQIVKSRFNTSADGNRVIGYYDINFDNDPEMGLRFGFRNSYDKSMSVAALAGSQIFICENGMIKSDGLQYMRKHTGSVLRELKDVIFRGAEQLERQFIEMKVASSKMKNIELTKQQAAEMYGRMFMIDDIITSTQLNIVKRQLNNPSFDDFKDDTLWSAYNHVTYALKESHPNTYFQQHINLHNFVETEYQLV